MLIRLLPKREYAVISGREVLSVGQQRVFLSFDAASAFAREARVLGLANLVQRIPQVTHIVELVEQDCRLG